MTVHPADAQVSDALVPDDRPTVAGDAAYPSCDGMTEDDYTPLTMVPRANIAVGRVRLPSECWQGHFFCEPYLLLQAVREGQTVLFLDERTCEHILYSAGFVSDVIRAFPPASALNCLRRLRTVCYQATRDYDGEEDGAGGLPEGGYLVVAAGALVSVLSGMRERGHARNQFVWYHYAWAGGVGGWLPEAVFRPLAFV